MAQKKQVGRSRLSIAAAFCIILGLGIGFLIKRVHVGLFIGIGLGLLSGGLLSKRK
ncbi:hypothetical protein [uncultured Chitinophaga sp.]|uniref:hypothetical protein n=1 Tax=uncultured Chitinophaga sp. TaxID=339340 RepID=UPI0025E9B47C|nr:hypothetical protein [uncultured Chitinophaga sp.]